jgi:hypothetical protein
VARCHPSCRERSDVGRDVLRPSGASYAPCWPDLSHGLVEVSSLATRVKIVAGVLTEALMGALAVAWLMRCGSWAEEGSVECRFADVDVWR